MTKTIDQGTKYDGDKLRYSLLPSGVIESVIEVLEYGARKYAPDNWKKVPDARTRYYNAALRHIQSWYYGQSLDEESNKHHLSHAICCLMFAQWTENNGGKNETTNP